MPTAARVVVLPRTSSRLEVQEAEIPDPAKNQIVVRQFSSGICHSQLHQMHREPREHPTLLGHESIGTAIAVGSAVRHVAEGDRVMVTWVPRDAAHAEAAPEAATLELGDGSVARCQNVFTWADHTLADQQFVVKVPDDTATDVTAIIGCAVITGAGAVLHTAGVTAGQSVAIFGVGGVGLCAVAAARRLGADPIIAVDLDDEKLAFAERFGATHGVNAARTDPIAAIHELTKKTGRFDILGRERSGADFAFDCIGLRVTMEQIVPAVHACQFGGVSHGGTAVLVGVPSTEVTLNALDVLIHEKRFIGSIGGSCTPDRDFPRFLDWYRNGSLPLDELVTRRYRIDEINEATTALEKGEILGRSILEFEV